VSKQSLLLVDGDTRSLRVLEVSLRKAGFTVTPAVSVQDALDKLELHAPDLIISETTFTDGDGFELRRRVRATQDWAEIPFIFLTAEAAIENKIRGLELGVDDYLTKPIYIKEIVTRINILLQKRQRIRFEERKDGRTRFAGRVADMPVVDVIQTIEISRKSGVIQFVGERGRQAAIYFRDGRVIDAEAGTLQGEDAVYRLLTWSEGEFEVVFRTVRRREVIQTSSQGLLMEGMRRLDEWSRLLEQLPPLTHRFEIDAGELATRLGDVPDDNNRILRLIDGKRTLLEVIDNSDFGDLECLQAISRLFFEEILMDLDHGKKTRRTTGQPMPLVEVTDVPTPIEEVASGPHAMAMATGRDSGSQRALRDSGSHAAIHEELGVRDSQVISEEAIEQAHAEAADADSKASMPAVEDVPVEQHAEVQEVAPVQDSALMGRYRPSSLRLIDDAIAAAQAIDPSLFADGAVASQPKDTEKSIDVAAPLADPSDFASEEGTASGVPALETTETSIPLEIPAEAERDGLPSMRNGESNGRGRTRRVSAVPPPEQIPSPLVKRNDDSGLRMIGSLGRDRAEASGELVPASVRVSGQQPAVVETQRELVTILPRRITREMAIVQPPADAPASPAPTPTTPTEIPAVPSVPRVATPRSLPVGSGVRRRTGPGGGALALIALAVVLAVLAVVLWLRKPNKTVTTTDDAAVAVELDAMQAADAGIAAVEPDAAVVAMAPDASVAPSDAAVIVLADAAVATNVDASIVIVGPTDAGAPDPLAQAKLLYQQAHGANQEGDFAKALELADASLKLRRTARANIVRAQALQRLGRLEEAISAMESAIKLAPKYASNYEVLGSILWAAQRYDEATKYYVHYLDNWPEGEKSLMIQKRLDSQR
jgi:CheY-like chemotaxis protein/Flp pilus assembly protein TadD